MKNTLTICLVKNVERFMAVPSCVSIIVHPCLNSLLGSRIQDGHGFEQRGSLFDVSTEPFYKGWGYVTTTPHPSESLPRERFWDIQVTKTDSQTRQPLLPRPSCAHVVPPQPRKLVPGYTTFLQMTGRDLRMPTLFPLWR